MSESPRFSNRVILSALALAFASLASAWVGLLPRTVDATFFAAAAVLIVACLVVLSSPFWGIPVHRLGDLIADAMRRDHLVRTLAAWSPRTIVALVAVHPDNLAAVVNYRQVNVHDIRPGTTHAALYVTAPVHAIVAVYRLAEVVGGDDIGGGHVWLRLGRGGLVPSAVDLRRWGIGKPPRPIRYLALSEVEALSGAMMR